MTKFNFNEEITPQEWFIEGLIPKGSIVGVIAQSTSGKSTFVNAMMMYVLAGRPFLKRPTEKTDVLLIDQDSQEKGLKLRLKRLHKQISKGNDADLFFKYMGKLYFKDGSIYEAINKHPSANLVVIDAYHKVGGTNFDFNSINSVATAFEQLKTKCCTNNNRTVIIIHHASEKTDQELTADDYMTTGDFSKLAMGSSAFIESTDCYYIIASPNKGGCLEKIFVRGISKRVMIPNEPFFVNVEQDDPETMDVTYGDLWYPKEPESVQHVKLYFDSVTHTATINDLVKHFEGQYTRYHFEKALKWLEIRGLAKYTVEASNRFRWELVEQKDGEQNGIS
ncbi:AAA family ATPase [Chloroflexota bacterium]